MDPELIAYLDERFRETTRQIEGLREETTRQIQGLREETTQQIQGLREETTQQIQGLRGEINQRFQQIDGRFDRVEESVRLTRVEVEDLRGQIQLVAEGVVGTQETLAAFRAEVAEEFKEVRAAQSRNYSDLDHRVSILEAQAAR